MILKLYKVINNYKLITIIKMNIYCNCIDKNDILHGCFGEDVPILLSNRLIRKSQDIRIGDSIMGNDYTERIVEEVINGEDDLFEVRQVNGINYTVNSKHILLFKNIIDNDSELIFEMSTEQYMSLNEVYKSMLSGYKCKKNTINLSKNVDKEPFSETLVHENTFSEVHGTKENTFSEVHSTKENTFSEVHGTKENTFSETLVHENTFSEVHGTKENTFSETLVHENTPITITHIGKGKYYGWAINDNKKFLLSDLTVVHNCNKKYCKKCGLEIN